MAFIIGKYIYYEGDVLGKGAFGNVYKGYHVDTREVVAIKKVEVNSDPTLIQRESVITAALTQLQHENIVKFLDCRMKGECFYLIMEFCKGGSLSQYIKRNGSLNENTLRIFLRQIGAGLKAIHDKDIIHRDLKPANLLLMHNTKNPTPSEITVKIADFGLARFLWNESTQLSACGTPAYVAPEVATKNYDAKVDLWSIGKIIHTCIGYEPEKQAYISRDLQHLINSLLQKDPRNRMNLEAFLTHPFLNQYGAGAEGPPRHFPSRSSSDSSAEEKVDTIKSYPTVDERPPRRVPADSSSSSEEGTSYPTVVGRPRPRVPSSSSSSSDSDDGQRGNVRHKWVTKHQGSKFSDAFLAGIDSNEGKIFVGQAWHHNQLLPAKIVPNRDACYISYEGQEHKKENYKILCGTGLKWVPVSNGEVPPNSVKGGHTLDGENIYIGKIDHRGSICIGRVRRSMNVCYFTYGGREIAYQEYEILVHN